MKKSKIIRIIAIIMLTALAFSGCTNGQRLSDLTLVQAVGVDLKDDKIQVAIQYLNLDKNAGSTDALSGNITSVARGTSQGISAAVSAISKVLSQKVFFGQNKLIVFGKDYAEKSLVKGMDYLIRSVDSRPDVLVAMSSSNAFDVVENSENDSKIPAERVYDLLELGEQTGLGASLTVNELLNLYAEPTSDIYLPVLEVRNERVACSGVAVFSKEKYALTLNEFQTFGLLLVNGKITGGAINVKSNKLGNIGVEIIAAKTHKSASFVNGKLRFNVDVDLDIMLDEVEQGTTTAVQEKEIKSIESLISKKVHSMCYNAVTQCYSNRSDPFKTGKLLARHSQKQYNMLKDNWRDNLANATVNINMKTNLQKVNDNSVRQ